MSAVHKAVIRTYDSGTHTASVQLTGSLAHYLAGIRVATNIPAAAVVAGRECTVLALDPNNPTDALVLSIQNALPPTPSGATVAASATVVAETAFGLSPSAGSASPYSRGDHTHGSPSDHAGLANLAYADAAHTGFLGLADAQTITGQKLIDSAVGLRFGHAAGPLLQGPASGDDLTLTGDLRLTGLAALAGSAITAQVGLNISPGTGVGLTTGILIQPTTILATSAAFNGVFGQPVMSIASGATNVYVKGLNYTPAIGGGGGGAVVAELFAIEARPAISGFTGTITAMKGLNFTAPFISGGTPSIATAVGVDIPNYGVSNRIVDAYGIRIADLTLNTGVRRLIEAGPAVTPNLRLLANAPPNAGLATEGDSQLFLAWMENGVVNLRRVRWRAQASLGAADKVLIAA
jgi:hypothetical protein